MRWLQAAWLGDGLGATIIPIAKRGVTAPMSRFLPVESSLTIRIMWGTFIVVDSTLMGYWALYWLDMVPMFLPDAPQGAVNGFFMSSMALAITGLISLIQWRRNIQQWRAMALASLMLTFAAGLNMGAWLMAEVLMTPQVWLYWLIASLLVVYPLVFTKRLVRNWKRQATQGH